MINIGIFAATYSGNKGAAAMLSNIVDKTSKKHKDTVFSVFSVYPEEDEKQKYHKNVNIISAKPKEVVFKIFPLSLLFFLFKNTPLKRSLLKNKILKAYCDVDYLIDAAGVSFIDSRGFTMNTYNFICMAIPLLLNVPVMKFSQAMGSFNSFYNRIYAKIILPKLEIICARGEKTENFLKDLDLDNIDRCADGAFGLLPSPDLSSETIFNVDNNSIVFSVSSVVYKYCKKNNIDYISTSSLFIDYLVEIGYEVVILANGARKSASGLKNNDLPICAEIYNQVKKKDKVFFQYEEFTPYQIWQIIGNSKALVGSRFHAMIAALDNGIPVLLVGWSHKYEEVLADFNLSFTSIDYKHLSFEHLVSSFDSFMNKYDEIKELINKELPKVLASSEKNYEYIESMILKYSKDVED